MLRTHKLILAIALAQLLVFSNAQAEPNMDQGLSIRKEIELTYYWAFHGYYTNDGDVVGDVLSRLSDIDSRIFDIQKEEAYRYYKMVAERHGGPQVLLAELSAKRVLAGEMMGLHSEVDAYLESVSRLNSRLAISLLGLLSSIYDEHRSGIRLDDPISAVSENQLMNCLERCQSRFLKLDNEASRTAYLFPTYHGSKGKKLQFRTGIDPKVASISNSCIRQCTEDIKTDAIVFGGVGAAMGKVFGVGGVVAGGGAGALVGTAIGGLRCSNSDACGKTRELERLQEKNSEEKARVEEIKNKNDRAEEELRSQRIERERKEKVEKENQNQNKKKAKESESSIIESNLRNGHQSKEEKEILEAADPSKNERATKDSSLSCVKIGNCDGTMSALQIPEKYTEPRSTFADAIELNDLQDEMTILRSNSESENGRDSNYREENVDSTPGSGKYKDEPPQGEKVDSFGNVVTQKDMTGTPGGVKIIFGDKIEVPKSLDFSNPQIKIKN